nr:response regulator transcription factor [uncultured Oscillibacter sp.]
MKKLIYAADDDPNILNVLEAFLSNAGFDIQTFPTGDELKAAFSRQTCDLIILDVMMPGTDGMALCKQLRDISNVPIVILTAKESEMDQMMGLTLGGDDYLTKPFSPTLLVMRVKALLRRVEMSSPTPRQDISFGDLTFSETEHAVLYRGKSMGLTAIELSFMRCLLEHTGAAVSRDTLLNEVWGIEADVETRVTDETVRRIRRKLKAAGSRASILAVWGYGYRLEANDEKGED